MTDFTGITEESLVEQMTKVMHTCHPADTLNLISVDAIELFERCIIPMAHTMVQSDPELLKDPVLAGDYFLKSIASLAFGLGLATGIEVQASKEFAEMFGGS